MLGEMVGLLGWLMEILLMNVLSYLIDRVKVNPAIGLFVWILNT